MRRENLPILTERLTQLAEAFDRKPPTAGAMLVWLDVLKEFGLPEVESMLVDMPKRLTKFPAPADVYKACNERRSDRIEKETQIFSRTMIERVTAMPVNTPTAREEMKKIREIISYPRPNKRAWIERIFQQEAAKDKSVCGYAVALAHQAQRKFSTARPPIDIEI